MFSYFPFVYNKRLREFVQLTTRKLAVANYCINRSNYYCKQMQSSAGSNKLPVVRSRDGFVTIDGGSKYRLIAQTAVAATILAIFKWLLTKYSAFSGYIILSDLGLVYTGLFFITGILFGQVTGDLKEAEKMPAEMAANFEQLEEFFKLLVGPGKKEDLDYVYALLMKAAFFWRVSLHENYDAVTEVYVSLTAITDLAARLDPKGGVLVVNIVNVVDKTRRLVQRGSSLSRTSIIPSAHGLVQFFVLVSTVMLFFVKYTHEATQMLVMICIYTVTWFSVRMVSSFDDPFEDEVFLGMTWLLGTNRLVHMFPLDEFALRVMRRRGTLAEIDTGREDLDQEVKAFLDIENYVGVAHLLCPIAPEDTPAAPHCPLIMH